MIHDSCCVLTELLFSNRESSVVRPGCEHCTRLGAVLFSKYIYSLWQVSSLDGFKAQNVSAHPGSYTVGFSPSVVQWMSASIHWSVSPELWCRLKHLKSYWMDCLEILCRHSWSTKDESYTLSRSTDFSSAAASRQISFPLKCLYKWMCCPIFWSEYPTSSKFTFILWNISTHT